MNKRRILAILLALLMIAGGAGAIFSVTDAASAKTMTLATLVAVRVEIGRESRFESRRLRRRNEPRD